MFRSGKIMGKVPLKLSGTLRNRLLIHKSLFDYKKTKAPYNKENKLEKSVLSGYKHIQMYLIKVSVSRKTLCYLDEILYGD